MLTICLLILIGSFWAFFCRKICTFQKNVVLLHRNSFPVIFGTDYENEMNLTNGGTMRNSVPYLCITH